MEESDRDQGNCELVSCSHHEDGDCANVVCVLSDREYQAGVSREGWIEYYETRDRDHPVRRLAGRIV